MSIFRNGMGHELRLWPVLSLLLIVVLIPTACLLWFMNRAIENERLAMRKTLEDAYRRDLANAQKQLERFWKNRIVAITETANGRHQPAEIFAQCVRSGWAESVVCYDGQGQVIYPAAPAYAPDQTASVSWAEARDLEYVGNDPVAAAKAYATIAQESADLNLAARALQAQGRCLVQAGARQAAVELITGPLADEKYQNAVDLQGRLIVPSAQLMALQLMEGYENKKSPLRAPTEGRSGEGQGEGERTLPTESPHPTSPRGRGEIFHAIAERLQKRLDDYGDSAMSGAQRCFLMHELKHLLGERAELPLLAAEDLAARFVELNSLPQQDAVLHPSGLPGIWQLALSGGRLVALWHEETILSQSNQVVAESALAGEVTIALRRADGETPPGDVLYSLPAGKYLTGWQLTLSWTDGGLAETAANRRIAMYFWTGILVITAICILAGMMVQVFRKQMRHARLKNDLVATVSHELKTPLSSIRLLVDTLLDEHSSDADKTRDYLQLIAQENIRLSRLIDNFLAFSRMERNKYAFQFSEISVATIISEAVASVRERFEQPSCHLEVDVAANLPLIMADVDALVTVVLNLLDNAYKYTGDQKRVVLKAYAENGNVCIVVTDNGVGLSRSATKKVFDRFYQVDRRLSRSAGGCGLGLSIVKFIVTAHGGTVEVDSQPNVGSRFTIKLPSPDTPRAGAQRGAGDEGQIEGGKTIAESPRPNPLRTPTGGWSGERTDAW